METNPRPAYYALPAGAWRDYVTLLHLPYTAWHLSYVVIGAAAAPVLHLDRLAGVIVAFFLAVGVASHALDEYRGRPLQTSIPDPALLTIAVSGMAGAIVIGISAAVVVNLWAVPFVIAGVFLVTAYNLELFGGRFHSDIWFGLAWGAFPVIVSYWANAEQIDFAVLVLATACFVLSLAQRTLSNRARRLRRTVQRATGAIEFHDGRVETVDLAYLVATPELALRLTGGSVILFAVGWLLTRL